MVKIRGFVILLLLISQTSFSQTEKLIQGKVLFGSVPLKGVEVINLVSKKTAVTDEFGMFYILVKPKDVLAFYSDNYEYEKVYLGKQNSSDNIMVTLKKKPEQLKEIIIKKRTLPVALDFDSKKIVDQRYIEEQPLAPRHRFVYDGTIENGIDFVNIGKELIKLSKKTKVNIPKPEFNKLITTLYDQSFFTKTLKLKTEEINPFITFCENDLDSKTIFDDNNILKVLNFLMIKSEAFKEKKLYLDLKQSR